MKIRKLFALLTAIMIAASTLTACGRQIEHIDITDETGTSGEIILDEDGTSGDILYNSYRMTELADFPPRLESHDSVGNILIQSWYDSAAKKTMLHWYNAETEERGEFVPRCAADKVASHDMSAYVLNLYDGRVGILCTVSNQLQTEMEVMRRCIEIYDDKMNYVETIEIPEEVARGQFLYNGSFTVDAEGNYYCIVYDANTQTKSVECYDKAFQHYGNITYPTNLDIREFFQGGHGEIYAHLINGDYKNSDNNYSKIYRLDAGERTCTEIAKPISVRGWTGPNFCAGTGEYDFYYSDDYGIYGMQGDTFTCVMNYINSDIAVGTVFDYAPFANGSFYLRTLEEDTWQEKNNIAVRRTPEEYAGTELITLSTVGMYDRLEDIVIAYNKQDTGVRIILQDYADYNTSEDQSLGHAKLREDLLDGIVADMVCTDGLNFESLAGKGLFADWYDLMDEDPEFNRSDYLENYFQSMEYDGRLQKLGVSFRLHTAAAKTEHVGEKQGRTLAEFMQQPLSGGMELFQFYNQQFATDFWFKAAQSSFIDRKNARCYFDTPEFVQLLEMIKGYSSDEYTGIWVQTVPGEQPPVDIEAFLEDRALVKFNTFSEPIDYYAMIRTVFRDTPITLMGYPTAEGNSNGGVFQSDFTLSVNAQSEKKDAVWDFMKYLLSEKFQKKLNGPMPIHRGILEEKLTLATKMVGAAVFYGDTSVNIGAATQESMDTLRAYIESINTAYYYDATVEQVLREEMEMFLAGDQSAENAAKMMQSRVSIYLSEQS